MLARVVSGEQYTVVTDYSYVGKIQRIAEDINATIKNTEYLEKVSFTIEIEAGSSLSKHIVEGTNGKATVQKDCDLLIEIPI